MTASPDPGTERILGAFTDSIRELVSYRYIGCQSVMLDRDHAEGRTNIRAHLRNPGSVSGTALAISMMDTAGINVDRVHLLGLTQIDVQVYEPALDVARVRTIGRVLRWARTQVFTECRFEDDDVPGRVIGIGAANWSIIAPTPAGFAYADPGTGLPEGPDTPSMLTAFGFVDQANGGLVLPALSPRVGTEVLHHGPMLVGAELECLGGRHHGRRHRDARTRVVDDADRQGGSACALHGQCGSGRLVRRPGRNPCRDGRRRRRPDRRLPSHPSGGAGALLSRRVQTRGAFVPRRVAIR